MIDFVIVIDSETVFLESNVFLRFRATRLLLSTRTTEDPGYRLRSALLAATLSEECL